MPEMMARVTVRAAVTLALTAAFVGAIFTGQEESAIAALAGPMGLTLGFYFRNGNS